MKCQPVSTTFLVLKISCLCGVFGVARGAGCCSSSAGARGLTTAPTSGLPSLDPTQSPGWASYRQQATWAPRQEGQ